VRGFLYTCTFPDEGQKGVTRARFFAERLSVVYNRSHFEVYKKGANCVLVLNIPITYAPHQVVTHQNRLAWQASLTGVAIGAVLGGYTFRSIRTNDAFDANRSQSAQYLELWGDNWRRAFEKLPIGEQKSFYMMGLCPNVMVHVRYMDIRNSMIIRPDFIKKIFTHGQWSNIDRFLANYANMHFRVGRYKNMNLHEIIRGDENTSDTCLKELQEMFLCCDRARHEILKPKPNPRYPNLIREYTDCEKERNHTTELQLALESK
jgi:hypothetical protein